MRIFLKGATVEDMANDGVQLEVPLEALHLNGLNMKDLVLVDDRGRARPMTDAELRDFEDSMEVFHSLQIARALAKLLR